MELHAMEVTVNDKQGQHHKCSKQRTHKMLTTEHECTTYSFPFIILVYKVKP